MQPSFAKNLCTPRQGRMRRRPHKQVAALRSQFWSEVTLIISPGLEHSFVLSKGRKLGKSQGGYLQEQSLLPQPRMVTKSFLARPWTRNARRKSVADAKALPKTHCACTPACRNYFPAHRWRRKPCGALRTSAGSWQRRILCAQASRWMTNI